MTESVPQQFLVPSKLSVPYLPPNAIHRPRVEQVFVDACKLPVVVLCAPAGFGKTTAALHGFAALKDDEPEARLAWLSLDPEDSDPYTFAAYFISAIAKQLPLSEQLCHAGVHDRNTQLKSLFGQLLFELDRIHKRLILVLDDYHVVDSEEVHSALAYLAKHLPPHITLVLTTRSDPPASIMSLRLQGLVADMQTELLGFTVKEAQSFFQRLGGYQLDDQDVQQLLDHVEGWAVGLQLIVLGLKSKPSFDELKARLDQKNLNAIDYFDSEVFDALPADVQHFMLNTSIVKRFNADIARALTEDINVHEVLEFLQRQHLFIIQFNEPQQWFRYHHLLREFLQHKLMTMTGGDIRQLHYQASQAFLDLGYIVGAVDHAVKSRDQEQIIKILRIYGEDLIHKAHYELVQRCLAELSMDIIASAPQLVLVYCWVEAIFGDARKVDPCLEKAWPLLETSEGARLLEAEFETVRSQAYYSLSRFEEAERASQHALELFPADNTRRQSALLTYANVKFEQRDLDRALEIYEESELLSRQEANHDAVLWSLNQQAQIWRQRCRFDRAIALSREVMDYSREHGVNYGFNACFSLLCQADLALESYHLREARLLINEVGLVCQNWDEFWTQHLFGWLLKMELLKGKPTTARELAQQHESILTREAVSEQLMPYSIEVQLLYWWQSGEVKKIDTWLKATADVRDCYSIADVVLLRSRLYGLCALDRYDQALERLDAVLDTLNTLSDDAFKLERIRLGLLRVTILEQQQQREAALTELKRLLPDIVEHTIVASILYLRQWIMPVFEALDPDALTEDEARCVEQLLILYKQRNTTAKRGEDEVPDGLMALGISKKEWRVLRYIMDGKSNDEIAQTMFIAVSTVKTHINNLYKKLAVTNRKEAISKGRELSLGAVES
ncbi:LuxR C-terminal-related transcriptional regulator [Saccharospirillum salsuginis]|uniref:HTH-type transcriptional regulator MalT n=1 Tax=Saccharospirillum salsuginis TaxID=418750 RepID=A0A918K807_9GAMM|nr:LuxR C-terminal-related transcriptional regulator [Saccharospirillum salsuginis]GGX53830.1 HTH-type transcriptional regulator MalT [Saccharospirillum salsuginis]